MIGIVTILIHLVSSIKKTQKTPKWGKRKEGVWVWKSVKSVKGPKSPKSPKSVFLIMRQSNANTWKWKVMFFCE
jgi:hypothetical protein